MATVDRDTRFFPHPVHGTLVQLLHSLQVRRQSIGGALLLQRLQLALVQRGPCLLQLALEVVDLGGEAPHVLRVELLGRLEGRLLLADLRQVGLTLFGGVRKGLESQLTIPT